MSDGVVEACDREPIHAPGSIQPHGHLLALEGPDLLLAHASAAAAGTVLPGNLADAFGQQLERGLLGELDGSWSERLRCLPEAGVVHLGQIRARSGSQFQALAHRSPDGLVILELEMIAAGLGQAAGGLVQQQLHPLLRQAFDRLASASTLEELAARGAEEVRRLSGFDRALIYCFDDDWNGTVIGEARNERLPAYLGLRFPASDIPAQARRLYEINRHRLIPDVDYVPVPVLSADGRGTGDPLDLGLAVLRSVSPVHREYMRNMGTPASMSVSLLRGGHLWGLISCHHAEPRWVPFAVREACDLVAQMLAVRAAAIEAAAYAADRNQLKSLERRLLVWMAEAEYFEDGLADHQAELCAFLGAAGAAVLSRRGCTLVGQTPPAAYVRRVAAWLGQEHGLDDVFATSRLSSALPDAASFADVASGLLAMPISARSSSFVVWFRPEIVQTVTWGGDPRKPLAAESGQLHPRRSFEVWKETVRGQSSPWSASQIEAARDLRAAIVQIVLTRVEERAALTGRMLRINKELTAFSYSVSHDLRAPFRHIVGYAELLKERASDHLDPKSQHYLRTIMEAGRHAGALVDALLHFAQTGRAQYAPTSIDMVTLVADARQMLEPDTADRRVEWRIGSLPHVTGDATMLRQLLLNLLSNAIKYTRGRDPAVIEVDCTVEDDEFVFVIRDNGAGFEMAYAPKLFGVFQRLHRAEEFEGIGIGLANVRRIAERHGGRTWAEGEQDRGASFFFTLPLEVVRLEAR